MSDQQRLERALANLGAYRPPEPGKQVSRYGRALESLHAMARDETQPVERRLRAAEALLADQAEQRYGASASLLTGGRKHHPSGGLNEHAELTYQGYSDH